MPANRIPLTLPDLGLAPEAIATGLWLVKLGSEVSVGDRLIEVVGSVVTVDLPSPVNGVLAEQVVGEDETVLPGQTLGWLEERDGELL